MQIYSFQTQPCGLSVKYSCLWNEYIQISVVSEFQFLFILFDYNLCFMWSLNQTLLIFLKVERNPFKKKPLLHIKYQFHKHYFFIWSIFQYDGHLIKCKNEYFQNLCSVIVLGGVQNHRECTLKDIPLNACDPTFGVCISATLLCMDYQFRGCR